MEFTKLPKTERIVSILFFGVSLLILCLTRYVQLLMLHHCMTYFVLRYFISCLISSFFFISADLRQGERAMGIDQNEWD